MKTCAKCNMLKNLTEYYKCRGWKGGLHARCKVCVSAERTELYQKDPEVKIACSTSAKKHRAANTTAYDERTRNWAKANPTAVARMRQRTYKKHRLAHPKPIRPKRIPLSRGDRQKIDPLFKLACGLRSRLHTALKAKKWHKDSHFKDYIGCSLEALREHLENQFTVGMDWSTHCEKGWHIDHIIPLDSAKTVEEMIKLCHYTNLQPLWWDDNIRKGNKIHV